MTDLRTVRAEPGADGLARPARTWVDALSRVVLEPAMARELGLAPELGLRRAWPRSPDHVLVELLDSDGIAVAGQWMREEERLARVIAETSSRCPGLAVARVGRAAGNLFLQPRGADRVLLGLPALVAAPGSRLLVHRPERRAVVRVADESSSERARYVKVVPPSRLARLVDPLRALAAMELPFRVPPILEIRADQGQVVLGHLEGTSLHELLDDAPAMIAAVRSAGRALRALHDQRGLELAAYDGTAVAQELRRRLRHLAVFDPPTWAHLAADVERVLGALEAASSPLVPIHRDFHDKQIVIGDGGRAGVLDLDTVSLGEAALDVANLLVHLELRALQGLCTEARAGEAAAELLEAYAPAAATRERLRAYADATRLRLAFLYAFRPAWSEVPARLVTRLGECSAAGGVSR